MLVSKQLFLKYVLNKRPENLSLEPCLQDFVNKFLKKKYFRRHFKENLRKTFVTFSRFWPLKEWG